jgi:predicted helicase
MSPDNNPLYSIHTFKQLVTYLRNELDWPIESDDFEELTFDYAPEELGLDAATAVKIKEIKQLRPLTSKQPWGVFFVNFEPKHLPVVVLRRILSKLVIKKRQSANKSQQAAWQMHDLLFVSSYGEDAHRDITFAHFSEEHEMGDLPTLRVLGWDDEDTKLKVSFVEHELKTKLRWPEDDKDVEAWRLTWASAFKLRPREVIRTSQQLAIRLAELARSIRKRANNVLAIESAKGPLRKLHAAFKEALIHDLEADDFADMYAQTISYGLLTARVSRPSGLVADNLSDMVPVTNPFLKELLETFLTVGGRKGKIDFDELGINEVVQLLRDADMEAVLRDFGDRNPQEDPVIHFYELFLKEYDAEKRMQRGVFYTPRPVVSFIVRSVHEILKKEFGLEDGLADTTTWNEMLSRNKNLRPSKGVSLNKPFVQILDPAAGTGTFLVEVIEIIHRTMEARWEKQGHASQEFRGLWNEYVPKHLLPRLHGFELMMAPYAIAHMKIGLKLFETGYRFGSNERARVYLTNSLEPPTDAAKQMEFQELAPALAHEAQSVNSIKSQQRFTVIVGNPPYSNFGKLNKIPFIIDLLEDYKRGIVEKNISVHDDFIKFLRLSQFLIHKTGSGLVGMITNNTFFDGPTLRGMRNSLIDNFDAIRVVNLHGSLKKGEQAPDAGKDENVFDITVGVGISILLKSCGDKARQEIDSADLWGTRSSKYERLLREKPLDFVRLTAVAPDFYFVPKDFSLADEYKCSPSVPEIFQLGSSGVKTHRDELLVDYERGKLVNKFLDIARRTDLKGLKDEYGIKDTAYWTLAGAKKHVREDTVASKVRSYLYRPFDLRYIFYEPDIVERSRWEVMQYMLRPNLALICTRQTNPAAFTEILVSNALVDKRVLASFTGEARVYPLSISGEVFSLDLGEHDMAEHKKGGSRPNFSPEFLKALATNLTLPQSGQHGLPENVTSEAIFNYIYAVFNSPNYRSRYAEFLQVDFPRLPLTSSLELFRKLDILGGELVALHLLKSPKLEHLSGMYDGIAHPEVEKVSYGKKTIWIDKTLTCGFRSVSEEVWEFNIGGYQVCEKWLKDRKGRKLSKADVEHYQKIVVALRETIRVMAEVDKAIDAHGGWPAAFVVSPKATTKKASS